MTARPTTAPGDRVRRSIRPAVAVRSVTARPRRQRSTAPRLMPVLTAVPAALLLALVALVLAPSKAHAQAVPPGPRAAPVACWWESGSSPEPGQTWAPTLVPTWVR